MSACLAMKPPETIDAGLPALSGRLAQVRTRKDAFDLLACFLQAQGLPDLILTFIPPGDLANQTVQWSTLAGETSDRVRSIGFDGRDPVRRFARRAIEPLYVDLRRMARREVGLCQGRHGEPAHGPGSKAG